MSHPARRADLLQSRIALFTRMLPGVEAGTPRAVHRARVASRRLRELLPVLQLDRRTAHKLGRYLKKITRRLGSIREIDVLLVHLDEVRGPRGSVRRRAPVEVAMGREAMALLAARLRTERSRAHARVSDRLTPESLKRLARKLAAVATRLSKAEGTDQSARPWHWAVDARVAHRASALRAAIEEAGPVYLPERLHAVRIALKKLRYGVELAVEAQGLKQRPDLRLLRRLQDTMGRMHDLQVLMDRLRRAQADLGGPSPDSTLRDLDAVVRFLEDECRRMHARFMRSRDVALALCERLGTASGVRHVPLARRAG